MYTAVPHTARFALNPLTLRGGWHRCRFQAQTVGFTGLCLLTWVGVVEDNLDVEELHDRGPNAQVSRILHFAVLDMCTPQCHI